MAYLFKCINSLVHWEDLGASVPVASGQSSARVARGRPQVVQAQVAELTMVADGPASSAYVEAPEKEAPGSLQLNMKKACIDVCNMFVKTV